MGDFFGTGIEIRAGFGQVGITEKKILVNYKQLLRPVFFMFLWESTNILESALKRCIKLS